MDIDRLCEIITKVSRCTRLTIIKTTVAKNGRVVDVQESDTAVRTKPDLMVILLAVFGVGVLVTLLLPMAASDSVAAPASELQAGVIIGN